MKRVVYILSACFWIIIQTLLFTGCQKEEAAPSDTVETKPVFSWDGYSFLLETDNGWSITRFNNRIALSNFNRKCQCLLSWKGNMADGEKEDAVLKIAEVGRKLQNIPLDRFSITDINGMYYNIRFVQGEKEGMLVLSK